MQKRLDAWLERALELLSNVYFYIQSDVISVTFTYIEKNCGHSISEFHPSIRCFLLIQEQEINT